MKKKIITIGLWTGISNAGYAAIDDLNITITGYAIGTEEVSTNPKDAWSECKVIGNIQ